MANNSPVQFTGSFNMRTDEEFRDALDELRLAERPVLSQADMVRKLVHEAHTRFRARQPAQRRAS